MKTLRWVGLFVIGVVFIFGTWIFWARSPTLSKTELEGVQETGKPPGPVKTRYLLTTYNVGYASGLHNNLRLATKNETENNLSRIRAFIQTEKPDFVCAQEIDFVSHRSHGIDQVQYLGLQLFSFIAFVVNWDKRYVPFPYGWIDQHFRKINSGQAIFSQYPMRSLQNFRFSKPESFPFWKNWFYIDRIAMVTEVTLEPGKTFILVNVHLEAFDQATRVQQAIVLAELLKEYANRPLIVTGDFNSDPRHSSDETLYSLTKELKLTGAYERSVQSASAGIESIRGTFPSDKPEVWIDHIYGNPLIDFHSFRIHDEVVKASDHLPVSAQFSIRSQDGGSTSP